MIQSTSAGITPYYQSVATQDDSRLSLWLTNVLHLCESSSSETIQSLSELVLSFPLDGQCIPRVKIVFEAVKRVSVTQHFDPTLKRLVDQAFQSLGSF